ncbi:MAG: ECF transporter S component [Treponema sp.]|nr:ECF transporter S component [Treponema sp.]
MKTWKIDAAGLLYPRSWIAVPAVSVLAFLNLLFSWTNNVVLKSPLFLDSIFTAVGASILGPWAGMAVGLLTNLGMEPVYGMTGLYWPFAACNMATGLIVGIMARRGAFSRAWHATLAILLVTLANALLGGFIANLVFSGDTGVAIDHIVAALTETGLSLASANFWVRIPANLVDKMLAVYAAFGVRLFLEGRGRGRAGGT